MAITYLPDKLLRKIAPPKKVKNLITKRATLKKAALSFVDDIDFIDKKSVTSVALRVVAGYKKRIKDDSGERKEILKDPAQLIQRVENEVVLQVSERIKEEYSGESYIWLPSDADEPDPEHQLRYGKRYRIGEGEMPGERFGCKCGMEILVKERSLDL